MRRHQNIGLAVKVSGFLVLTMAVYYLLALWPTKISVRALEQAEVIVGQHNAVLVQSRLARQTVQQLSATDTSFNNLRTSLLQSLKDNAEAGISKLSQPEKLSYIVSLGSGNIIMDLNKDLSKLRQRHQELLALELEQAKSMAEFDAKLKNVFAYSPAVDLGGLDLQTNSAVLVQRARAAADGLQKVNSKLSPANSELQSKIVAGKDLLLALAAQTEAGDIATADVTRRQVFDQFALLKTAAWSAVLAPLRSSDATRISDEQKNLISGYRKLNEKISRLRATQK